MQFKAKNWGMGFAALSCLAIITSNMIDEGGVYAVIQDEVPPLRTQWFGEMENPILRVIAFVPTMVAVSIGERSGGENTFEDKWETLTAGVPSRFHGEILGQPNVDAAERASRRIWRTFTTEELKMHFKAAFRIWFEGRIACLTPKQQIALVDELSPALSSRISQKNIDFTYLANLEQQGKLTVGDREAYLTDAWRVGAGYVSILNGLYSDLSPAKDKLPQGSLVQHCGFNGYNTGALLFCSGYVAVNLFGEGLLLSPNYDWSSFERGVYSTHKQNGNLVDLILNMKEQRFRDAAALQEAELYVANLPASLLPNIVEVSLALQAQYKWLRCQTD
ncbi:MAG: hypothetical protein JKX71_05015 [Amylibacter sp.]|nr:hypothetical protein [Amylibacter sp.]